MWPRYRIRIALLLALSSAAVVVFSLVFIIANVAPAALVEGHEAIASPPVPEAEEGVAVWKMM